MPFEATDVANSDRRFPAESGPEDLQVPGPTERTAGAHSARTPGPPATEDSCRRNETDCTACQRTKTKDGVCRDVDDVAELCQ